MKSIITMMYAFWLLPLLIASSVAVSANGFVLPISTAAVPSLNSPPTLIKRHRGDTQLLESSYDVSISIPRGGGGGGGGGNDKGITTSSPAEERAKADEIMIYCARIIALSALFDLVVDGSEIFSEIAAGKWMLPLTTLWKVSLAFDMWRVSKLYKVKSETVADLYKLFEKIMISMTGIWQRLAFMVTLLTSVEVVSVWKDSLPNIRLALNVLFGVVALVSIRLSAKETQHLIAVEDSTNKVTSDGDVSKQRIAHLGRITVRAMLLGVVAFTLQSIMIPVTAFTKPRKKAIIELVHIITVSIPFAVLLFKLRKSLIIFIEDLTSSVNNTADNNNSKVINRQQSVGIQPKTQIQFAVAQQNFWGKIKSFQKTQMVLKALTVVVQLKLIQKLVGFFGK
jgi:hypothetical protein